MKERYLVEDSGRPVYFTTFAESLSGTQRFRSASSCARFRGHLERCGGLDIRLGEDGGRARAREPLLLGYLTFPRQPRPPPRRLGQRAAT